MLVKSLNKIFTGYNQDFTIHVKKRSQFLLSHNWISQVGLYNEFSGLSRIGMGD